MKISSTSFKKSNADPKVKFGAIPTNPVYLPNKVGDIGKIAGEYISMPEQKLFLALSALVLQPLIDIKYADEDKKTDVAIKSASKAIAGGVTGVTIRAGFIALAKKHLDITKIVDANSKPSILRKYFLPSDAEEMFKKNPELAKRRMGQYNSAIGTLAAIAFMILFTNNKIDVPLTSDLQDFIGGIVKENKTWTKSLSDTLQSRKQKIKNWFIKRKDKLIKISSKVKKVINAFNDDDSNTKSKGVSK